MRVAEKHNLWVVEDCCDALGATYEGQMVGTFGDVGTLSFYPAHHITMGEGGAVFAGSAPSLSARWNPCAIGGATAIANLGKTIRANVVLTGSSVICLMATTTNTPIPTLGYNMKITDMQAAVGLAQMDRLEGFIKSKTRQLRLPCRLGLKALEAVLHPARGHAEERSVVVRLCVITLQGGCAIHA